ncbi:MAG: hypothetical protein ACRD44_14525 [Bryobacteraceae bacterium]
MAKSELTRRGAIGLMAGAAPTASLAEAERAGDVPLHWLDGVPPPAGCGVSWGVPWPRGRVRRDQSFRLSSGAPLQTWPMAYWPDGSLKWSGFATVAGATTATPISISPGSPDQPPAPAPVTAFAQGVEIDTGVMQCRVASQGSQIIDSMTVDDRVVARHGRLVCVLDQEFTGLTRQVTVEQRRPVRAVIRIEGLHRGASREWLPFIVRLYFYAGRRPVRLVHTIIFDGDEGEDFLRGLGVAFEAPMREQVHNRHVRFSGENGCLWAEPLQPLTGGRRARGEGSLYGDHLAAKRVPDRDAFDAEHRRGGRRRFLRRRGAPGCVRVSPHEERGLRAAGSEAVGGPGTALHAPRGRPGGAERDRRGAGNVNQHRGAVVTPGDPDSGDVRRSDRMRTLSMVACARPDTAFAHTIEFRFPILRR